MEKKDIKIGIGDLNIGKNPDRLITIGLGSCIGIALFDKYSKIGGLAHIMLPDSTKFTKITNKLKFADLAIPILVDKMKNAGANEKFLKAKIAGGASMFSFADKNMNMDIGDRNAKAVKEMLKKYKIPIESEDVGGNKGRTITLNTENGVLQVKTIGLGIKDI
ncbi:MULTISPECIES: chemotaxis protein CheD [Clostridium]|uniref:Probable chemoreceptor glutamine deamidase CheD n=1 Tax=Clostridium senegalense TaxID=1465809 RepID=A0A6M0H033_9CLOT|nr:MULTISPECIES: chemotaxis protein CheD [Clostridium]NEU03474.1 chemotaxis protein CheD [Clostridium senegalense]